KPMARQQGNSRSPQGPIPTYPTGKGCGKPFVEAISEASPQPSPEPGVPFGWPGLNLVRDTRHNAHQWASFYEIRSCLGIKARFVPTYGYFRSRLAGWTELSIFPGGAARWPSVGECARKAHVDGVSGIVPLGSGCELHWAWA